jgi:hypothetical protein
LPAWKKPSGSEAICTQRVYKLSGRKRLSDEPFSAAIRSVRLWREAAGRDEGVKYISICEFY